MNKAQFTLLGVIITAGTALTASILPNYLPLMISIPLVTFVSAVTSAAKDYFATETPAPPNPA